MATNGSPTGTLPSRKGVNAAPLNRADEVDDVSDYTLLFVEDQRESIFAHHLLVIERRTIAYSAFHQISR